MFNFDQVIFDDDGEPIDEACQKYMDDLMAIFDVSPEAKTLKGEEGDNACWPMTLMHYGIHHFGVTVNEIGPSIVEEIVFTVFPDKVSVEADEAETIILELRAFWQFLDREFQLTNAKPILAILDDDAIDELEDSLDDSGNFGVAKTFVMAGKKAGFDMNSEAGLKAFTQFYTQRLLNLKAGSLSDQIAPDWVDDDEEELPPAEFGSRAGNEKRTKTLVTNRFDNPAERKAADKSRRKILNSLKKRKR